MLENLQWLTLATLVNLEFGWVKYWQIMFVSPKFPPPKFSAIWYILCVVLESTNLVLLKFIGHLEEYFDIPDWMGLYNRLRMHTIGRL